MRHISAQARAHDGHEPLLSLENETGAANVGVDALIRIARALDVRVRDLIEF